MSKFRNCFFFNYFKYKINIGNEFVWRRQYKIFISQTIKLLKLVENSPILWHHFKVCIGKFTVVDKIFTNSKQQTIKKIEFSARHGLNYNKITLYNIIISPYFQYCSSYAFRRHMNEIADKGWYTALLCFNVA